MSTIEPDHVWDLWSKASEQDASLTPAEFASRFGDEAADVQALLEVALDVREQAPPPSLVNLLTGEISPEDGRPRFAGFRLEEELGHGTSGIVFRATDLRPGGDGETVALKILNPLLAAAPERRELILREADIAGGLDHPGIVRVQESGVERGYAWIAAEHVEGTPLDEVIEDELPRVERARRAIDLVLQTCRALAHAHERGIIHRDLKPANVLLDNEGGIHILDFGLARSEGTAFALSSTGDSVGTPLYMAPEQARGDPDLGPQVDIFALGLLLCELAAGRRLASDPNLLRVLRRRARGGAGLPRQTVAGLASGLRSIVRRCVERNPADRYASCTELERDLLDVRDGRRPGMGSLSAVARSVRRLRRHPWRTISISSVLVVLGWAASYAWRTWPREVRFHSHLETKTLWIDGELIGNTPTSARLRPGRHTAEFCFEPHAPDPRAVFREEVFIPRGQDPLHLFFHFEPSLTVCNSPLFSFAELPVEREFADCPDHDGPLVWVQVSAKLGSNRRENVRLTVCGEVFERAPNVTAFRLPLGRHTISIEADGYRRIEREIELTNQRLCMFSFEMDPIDSPWHTVLLYSLAEYDVQRGIVDQDGLRVFLEPGREPGNDDFFVEKVYWGPTRNLEPGHVLVEVELPVSPGDLDLMIMTEATTPCGWSLVEAGASPEDLAPIWLAGPKNPPETGFARVAADEVRAEGALVHQGLKADLVRRLEGSTRLYLRFSAGGVSVGDDTSTACALRCNGLPDFRPDGSIVWWPAMRIRVRE